MTVYKIVIVDDHFVVREGLKLILETNEQFQVIGEAENGSQALPMIKELQPDVILMDLNMPVMGGLETMQELKRQGSSVPVIILTTYNEDELMISGLAIGAKGYLLKDTSRDNLFRNLESAVRGKPCCQQILWSVLLQQSLRRIWQPLPPKQFLPYQKKKHLFCRLLPRGTKVKSLPPIWAFQRGQ